jgi:hypothetical protein
MDIGRAILLGIGGDEIASGGEHTDRNKGCGRQSEMDRSQARYAITDTRQLPRPAHAVTPRPADANCRKFFIFDNFFA